MHGMFSKFICLMVILFTIASAIASDGAMFNYQGRVLVNGQPYTGAGQMKVAILATTGTSTVVTLWSNDGTGFAGSEPTASFPVSVTTGVFDVMVGDAALDMQALPGILFNRNDELKVRVWFNDGFHGFQQLTPDRRLTNPRRLGVTEVYDATTLYVNGSTGNDLNSGLSASAAKKTIQAAVNMVPSRLCNNVTVDVADGIYRETVRVAGITAMDPYRLIILGDEATIPSETASPSVRITGTDNDATHAKIRNDGFIVTNCHNVEFKGFLLDYFTGNGFNMKQGHEYITQCKTSYNNNGMWFDRNTSWINKSWSSYNSYGYIGYTQAQIHLTESGASDNGGFGALGQGYCTFSMAGNNYFRRNTFGIGMQSSYLWFESGTTYIQNNTTGIYLYYHSSSRLINNVSYSGNSTNITTAADSYASN